MGQKHSGTSKSSGQYDMTDNLLQGGTFLLKFVKAAAKYAPIPYLKQAAGSALIIFNAIATTKNNKEDLQHLAKDSVSIIVAIWRSYQISENQKEWPSRALRDVILDLARALDSIVQFVNARVSKPRAIRAVFSVFDARKIVEYRTRLNSAIQTLQVSSDLNVNETVVDVLKKQYKMMKHLPATVVGKTSNARPARAELEYAAYVADGRKKAKLGTPERHPEDFPSHHRPPPGSVTVININGVNGAGISIGGGGVQVVNR